MSSSVKVRWTIADHQTSQVPSVKAATIPTHHWTTSLTGNTARRPTTAGMGSSVTTWRFGIRQNLQGTLGLSYWSFANLNIILYIFNLFGGAQGCTTTAGRAYSEFLPGDGFLCRFQGNLQLD